MEDSLKDKFISKLEEKYGRWNKITSRFGTTSFGAISKDLSISSSQFSKLISGTATEGMYQRSIENINRLIQRDSIREELQRVQAEKDEMAEQFQKAQKRGNRKLALMGFGVFVALLLGLGSMYLVNFYSNKEKGIQEESQHPLSTFFDLEFNANSNSPYVDPIEVQEFCPCSAYEGSWALNKPYKLPIPGNRKPGVYYLAKSADVRIKCSHFDTLNVGKGRVLMGYEYLINEIWVDTKMTPLSPTYFDKESKSFTAEFEQLSFETQPQFKKVASIHSFFIDKFEIYEDVIIRKGEPCGRYASDINHKLAEEYEIDIRFLLEYVLGDMTTTRCAPAPNPFCDPNTLQEKESVINFDCIYTIHIENLGMGGGYPYQKGYRLEKQNYMDNLTCRCKE